MKAILATMLATVFALVLSMDAHAAGTSCAGASIAALNAPAPTAGRAVRCLVNRERAAFGLRPWRASRPLRIAAERHGADMVAHRFFAHVSPIFGAVTDRAFRSGYITRSDDFALGEDIAWGEGELSTPQSIVTAWMNSPGHRAVILSHAYREVGVGITRGVPFASEIGGVTFVLDAGAR